MSRTWELNEPVIHALKARLERGLPDRLQLIATDVGAEGEDLAMLRPPDQVLDFLPPLSYLTTFPTVAIGDDPSEIEDDTGSSATGRHGLLIVVFHTHVDQRVLAWGLRRYAQAVVAVALEGRVLDGTWGVGAGEIVPGPTLGSDEGDDPRTLMSFTGFRLWARRDEV